MAGISPSRPQWGILHCRGMNTLVPLPSLIAPSSALLPAERCDAAYIRRLIIPEGLVRTSLSTLSECRHLIRRVGKVSMESLSTQKDHLPPD